jgi:hypothetical protein
MTLADLLAVCAEHDLAEVDTIYVVLEYRDGESPLRTIERATRRCHLCLDRDDLEKSGGIFRCRDEIRCRYRARRRLGIPHRGRNGVPGAWAMLQDELAAAGRRPGVIGRR